jgi:hypothetical protein
MNEFREREAAGESLPLLQDDGVANPPEFRILKPAVVLFPGETAPYHALLDREGSWTLADTSMGWTLEWYLIRLEKDLEKYRVRPLGQGPKVKVDLPAPHSNYRILLKASKASGTLYCLDKLNTPLPTE